MALLTETADYDEPGSWGRMSEGWPGIKGDHAYDMFVFANCVKSIPYGSYVLINQKGQYGATESYLRVHKDHLTDLMLDFEAAGKPTVKESINKRETTGKLLESGNHDRAPQWWKV